MSTVIDSDFIMKETFVFFHSASDEDVSNFSLKAQTSPDHETTLTFQRFQ